MSVIGLRRRATIIKYNGDGTVTVRLDGNTSLKDNENTHRLSLPLAFVGPNGEFAGGIPAPGTPITVSQGQGEWFISGYALPNNLFKNTNITGSGGVVKNYMGELKENRLLFQTYKATNRIYIDPDDGIHSGSSTSEQIIDNQRELISHNISNELAFTAAHREIKGPIKRDLQNSSMKGLDSSILYSQEYDDQLTTIAMDPTTNTSISTLNGNVRNLPLVETRNITYEFENLENGLDFQSDKEEADKYLNNINTHTFPYKTDSRATAFSLNLHYPNHLVEEIKGTGVDSSGNILDINRNVLPIGRDDKNTFIKNTDNIDAFRSIRAEQRKSIAHHFEINARKAFVNDPIYEVSKASDKADYARNRSTFLFDVDKEGQFKLNVPMSSETGNIPLPVRYVNASVLAYENGDIDNPNSFMTEEDNIDIYLESFANTSNIKILGGESGETGPIDRFTDQPIKLGTVHHDITNAGFQFTKDRITQDAGGKLIRYMPDSLINSRQNLIQVDNFLTKEIFQSGPKANAGGRSGMLNFDGMLTFNIGANTIDRQSLWVDMAGGMIAMYGRDKNGVSYLGQYDGDVKYQIGGKGIGATRDLRFYDQNDAARSGSLDIRVIKSDGQLSMIRIDDTGVYIASPGRIEISAEQDLILKSNTKIAMEAPLIGVYTQSTPRWIKRNGVEI